MARCTYIVFCIPHDFWDSKRQLSRRDFVKSRPRAHLRGEHLTMTFCPGERLGSTDTPALRTRSGCRIH